MEKKHLLVFLFTLIISLIISETLLYIGEHYLGFNHFDALRNRNAESFHYYHLDKKKIPSIQPSSCFSRLFGWIDFVESKDKNNFIISPNNPHKWRKTYTVDSVNKEKKRVVMVGDSFVYGRNVEPNETIDYFLSEYLGNEYEIINLAVRGYGVDQMALVAINIAPKYNPDIVIVAFIADDLRRACTDFLNYAYKKPYYVLEDNKLTLKGTPVPSPYEVYMSHQTFSAKLKDAFFAWAQRSRTACLIAQFFLKPIEEKRLNLLTPLIFKKIRDELPDQTEVLLVHLDDQIPAEVKNKIKDYQIPFISLPPMLDATAKLIGEKIERASPTDPHPTRGLNHIYAYLIYKAIRNQVSN